MTSLIGQTLDGRYQIKAFLGEGQFAQVILASEQGSGGGLGFGGASGNRDVAIKYPKEGREAKESFEAELEFLTTCQDQAARLAGPDYGIGVLLLRKVLNLDRGTVAFVFNVVACDLLRISKQSIEGVPLPAAYRIAKDIARGLHFLHVNCKIVHMDVKLENIGVLDDESASPSSDFGGGDNPPINRAPSFGSGGGGGPAFGGGGPAFGGGAAFGGTAAFGGGGGSFGQTAAFGGAADDDDDAPAFGGHSLERAGTAGFGGAFGQTAAFGGGALSSGSSRRGMSPSRLLSPTTRFCLFDFGNATWLDPMREKAPVEQTVTYRSPEVIVRAPGSPDAAADTWSLGCVLWELASGKRLVEPTQEDLRSDGSRFQRVAQLQRQAQLLGEPLPPSLAQSYAALGGTPLPNYPAMDDHERAARLSQRLRAARQAPEGYRDAMADFGTLLARLLTMDPATRASAQEALQAAQRLEEASAARGSAPPAVVAEVDELDMAFA